MRIQALLLIFALIILAVGLLGAKRETVQDIVVPLTLEHGLPYIPVTIDGHDYKALLDTGASMSMIDTRVPHTPPYATVVAIDYRGNEQVVPVTTIQLCLSDSPDSCEQWTVGVVNKLQEPVLLSSELLSFAQTAMLDFAQHTLTLQGWGLGLGFVKL